MDDKIKIELTCENNSFYGYGNTYEAAAKNLFTTLNKQYFLSEQAKYLAEALLLTFKNTLDLSHTSFKTEALKNPEVKSEYEKILPFKCIYCNKKIILYNDYAITCCRTCAKKAMTCCNSCEKKSL